MQGHGDYHPKNILLACEAPGDETTLYVSAIDFERSQFMPPAFDVGWFLAQASSQFAGTEVPTSHLDDDFLEAYSGEAGTLPWNFYHQVELFRARAIVSIAAFYVKLGKEQSGELWRLLVEAERALAHLDEGMQSI